MRWIAPGPEETAPYARALAGVDVVPDAAGETVLLPTGQRRRLALWGDVDAVDPRRESSSVLEALEIVPVTEGDLLLLPVVDAALGRRLRDRGVAYVDRHGNADIRAPGLFIHVEGRRRATAARRSDVHGGYGGRISTPSGLRVVFALLCVPDLRQSPVRDVARAAAVSVGSAQQALHALRQQDYLVPAGRPQRALGRRGDLIRLWALGYRERLVGTLATRFVTAPTPPLLLAETLMERTDATLAGDAVAPTVRNGTGVVVFDRPPWADVVRVGRLRTAAEATDMVLRERFWDESLLMVGPTAPPLLTAAELLCTVDPRLREAGEQVLDEEARRG